MQDGSAHNCICRGCLLLAPTSNERHHSSRGGHSLPLCALAIWPDSGKAANKAKAGFLECNKRGGGLQSSRKPAVAKSGKVLSSFLASLRPFSLVLHPIEIALAVLASGAEEGRKDRVRNLATVQCYKPSTVDMEKDPLQTISDCLY